VRATGGVPAICDTEASTIGPAVVDASASGHPSSTASTCDAFDLGKLPPTILTDWAAPLLDGDLPLDVSIDVEPLELAWAKLQLDAARNALESSAPTPVARRGVRADLRAADGL
jgi:hypothetical protein